MKKNAVVLNDYMYEMGGGERSTLAYANALQSLGYNVAIATKNKIPCKDLISKSFGPDFKNIRIFQYTNLERLNESLPGKKIDLFINHSFSNYSKPIGKKSIYSVMFPGICGRTELQNIAKYDSFFSNSNFTNKYLESRWNKMGDVLLPPINLQRDLNTFKKEKTILNVGRFNPVGHTKNQHLCIRAFIDLKKKKSLKGWKLLLIGNINNSNLSKNYLSYCQGLIGNRNDIKILTNCSEDQLLEAYSKSFAYLHTSGAFLPPGTFPENCEHLGLSIIEAISYGCKPIAYYRGGIHSVFKENYIIENYSSYSELLNELEKLDTQYSPEVTIDIKTREILSVFSQSNFTERLSKLIQKSE